MGELLDDIKLNALEMKSFSFAIHSMSAEEREDFIRILSDVSETMKNLTYQLKGV